MAVAETAVYRYDVIKIKSDWHDQAHLCQHSAYSTCG